MTTITMISRRARTATRDMSQRQLELLFLIGKGLRRTNRFLTDRLMSAQWNKTHSTSFPSAKPYRDIESQANARQSTACGEEPLCQNQREGLGPMDTVCVIVLASNGNGGHKIVSEPLWGSAGSPFKRLCAGLSTSSSLLIHHLTSTSSNLHIESMDPLHTALTSDLMF